MTDITSMAVASVEETILGDEVAIPIIKHNNNEIHEDTHVESIMLASDRHLADGSKFILTGTPKAGPDTKVKFEMPDLTGEGERVFQTNGHLQIMKGESTTPRMEKNATVITINAHTTKGIPLPYLDVANKKIDEGPKLRIIKKMDGTSEWRSPMSFVPRPGGGIRSMVDLINLTKSKRGTDHKPFATRTSNCASQQTDETICNVIDTKTPE